jgi:multisubunit Na+/H+ antiporter MnhG subunit
VLLFVTTPTATHAISQAAHLEGLRPWTRKEESDG